MFFKSILFNLIVFIMTSCIIMAPRGGIDDMYSQSDFTSQKYKIKFIEITAAEIFTKEEAQIYLFASWCPYCLAYMRTVDRVIPNKKMHVSSNYDCKSMDRLFMNNIDTIYILSNSHYGSNESQKIKQFATELLVEENELTGVPQQFKMENGKYVRLISEEESEE